MQCTVKKICISSKLAEMFLTISLYSLCIIIYILYSMGVAYTYFDLMPTVRYKG